MKTQNKKLVFKKESVTELNDNTLVDVNGGSSPLCYVGSILVVTFVIGVVAGIANEVTKPNPE